MNKSKKKQAPRAELMNRNPLCITLSYRMVVAMVDIAEGYDGDDSPAADGRTLAALARRGLIEEWPEPFVATITLKGKAYLAACKYEYASAEEWLEATAA